MIHGLLMVFKLLLIHQCMTVFLFGIVQVVYPYYATSFGRCYLKGAKLIANGKAMIVGVRHNIGSSKTFTF